MLNLRSWDYPAQEDLATVLDRDGKRGGSSLRWGPGSLGIIVQPAYLTNHPNLLRFVKQEAETSPSVGAIG